MEGLPRALKTETGDRERGTTNVLEKKKEKERLDALLLHFDFCILLMLLLDDEYEERENKAKQLERMIMPFLTNRITRKSCYCRSIHSMQT